MKITILIPVLMAAASGAMAQTRQPSANTETQVPVNTLLQLPRNTVPQPQAKLLSVTAAGKAYALPLDNMPCLVPSSQAVVKMPVAVVPPVKNNMPNATPVQPVIPAQ